MIYSKSWNISYFHIDIFIQYNHILERRLMFRYRSFLYKFLFLFTFLSQRERHEPMNWKDKTGHFLIDTVMLIIENVSDNTMLYICWWRNGLYFERYLCKMFIGKEKITFALKNDAPSLTLIIYFSLFRIQITGKCSLWSILVLKLLEVVESSRNLIGFWQVLRVVYSF